MSAEDLQEVRRDEQIREAAIGQAAQGGGIDQARVPTPDTFIDQMGAPGISPDDDASELEAKLAAELSHHHVFSNIDRETWLGLKISNAALAMRVKAEHPPKTGPGSKCRGKYRREMFGDDKPTLTDDKAREVDSTLGEEGVRTMMQAKSIDGMAFKGATRVESVVHTGDRSSEDSGGLLGGLKDALGFGGDE